MKKGVFISVLCFVYACSVSEERCGEILQKINQNGKYYFVLQTDNYGQQINSDTFIPDDGVRQGAVDAETFEDYKVGEQYCDEN
ncbi:MAG: hypothetical protein ACPGVF_04455 [Flavobacteriaceae bacterium]